MAVFQTYQTVGIREDLVDIIYSIAPTETPFMSGVAVHKMPNGTIHTGKTHTKTSKPVVHFKDLSARAKKVARS